MSKLANAEVAPRAKSAQNSNRDAEGEKESTTHLRKKEKGRVESMYGICKNNPDLLAAAIINQAKEDLFEAIKTLEKPVTYKPFKPEEPTGTTIEDGKERPLKPVDVDPVPVELMKKFKANYSKSFGYGRVCDLYGVAEITDLTRKQIEEVIARKSEFDDALKLMHKREDAYDMIRDVVKFVNGEWFKCLSLNQIDGDKLLYLWCKEYVAKRNRREELKKKRAERNATRKENKGIAEI